MKTIVIDNRKAKTVLSKYGKSFDNSILLLSSAKKGLKPQAVFDFILLSQFPDQLTEDVFKKTLKTFTNYKQHNTLLDSVTSEKLLKLFSLYDKGIVVFGAIEEFNKWMKEPAFGLGNQIPRTLLDTITGIDLVQEELKRIEYGDLA